MIPALRDLQRLCIAAPRHAVHKPLLPSNPARPPARRIATEGVGFASALERIASAFLDQHVRHWIVVMEYGIPGANLTDKPHGDAPRAPPAP
jgi:hypothetical protein